MSTKRRMENLGFQVNLLFALWLILVIAGVLGNLSWRVDQEQYTSLLDAVHIHTCVGMVDLGARPVGLFDCSWAEYARENKFVMMVQQQLYFTIIPAALLAVMIWFGILQRTKK